jgi:hypothetical protein
MSMPWPIRSGLDEIFPVAGADGSARSGDGVVAAFVTAERFHGAVDGDEQRVELLAVILAKVMVACFVHAATQGGKCGVSRSLFVTAA